MKEGMPAPGPAPELRPFAQFAQGEKLADEQRTLNATIEAQRLTPEVQALNDKAQLEIYGSGNHTYVDPEGAIDEATGKVKVVASPDNPMTGKLDEIMTNPRYGKGTIEREKAKKAYLGDLEKLTDGQSGLEISQAKLVLDLREERQEADNGLSHKLVGNYIHKFGTKAEAVQKAEQEVSERQLLTGNRDDFVQRVIREKGIYSREQLDAFKKTPEYGEMVKANVTSERVKEAAAAREKAAADHVEHEYRRATGKNPTEPTPTEPAPDEKGKDNKAKTTTPTTAATGPTSVSMVKNPDTGQFVYKDTHAELAHIAANIVFNPRTKEFVYTDDAGKENIISDTRAKEIFDTLRNVSEGTAVVKKVKEIPQGPEPTADPEANKQPTRRERAGKAISKLNPLGRSKNKSAKQPKDKAPGNIDNLFPPVEDALEDDKLYNVDKEGVIEVTKIEKPEMPKPVIDEKEAVEEPLTPTPGQIEEAARRAEATVGTRLRFDYIEANVIGNDGTKVRVAIRRPGFKPQSFYVDVLSSPDLEKTITDRANELMPPDKAVFPDSTSHSGGHSKSHH